MVLDKSYINLNTTLMTGNAIRCGQGMPTAKLAAILRTRGYKDFKQALATYMEVPADILEVSVKGRNGGTYVHPVLNMYVLEQLHPSLHVGILNMKYTPPRRY